MGAVYPNIMSQYFQEIRILHWKGIYPGNFGGSIRTLNIARLAKKICEHTTLYSMDDTTGFNGMIAGVPVIQEKVSHDLRERIPFCFRALTSRELIVPYTDRAFLCPETSLFQIEDPRLYPLLKEKGITRFILDEHNVNWETHNFLQPQLQARIYSALTFRRNNHTEKCALSDATAILCCSIRDREILASEVPGIEDKISIIPNCVNISEYDVVSDKNNPWLKDPRHGRILFVGIMSYPPNIDAAHLICDIIAPGSPDLDFLIIGKNPPCIPSPQNVRFLGYIDDVKSVMGGADICIAPLRYGSGTRIKILEYMAMAKPVISTSKGAEGIEYTNGLNIIIEDRIEKYPEIIRELLDDEKVCSSIGREARKLIWEKYDWDLYQGTLKKIYNGVLI